MNSPHGGDVVGYALTYGRAPIDYSASLNPLGMPPAVRAAAIRAVEEGEYYPDPYARALKAALSARLEVEPSCLILGNGAADLIHRYVQVLRPKRALLPVPSFAEYGRSLEGVGCEVSCHLLREEDGFDLREDILDKIDEDLDLLFLCQPGNPTGRLIAPELLESILERCGQTATKVFLDECFLSFVEGGAGLSMVPRLGEFSHLFILGSFTKLYAMAGLRLGYGLCADSALMAGMTLNGQSWGISSVAQAAGLAALDEEEYVAESMALILRERAYLRAGLTALGAEVLGGEANYLFFRAEDGDLKDKLAQRGYLIRDCANFPGLRPGYYRVAVRTGEENRGLMQAMEETFRGVHNG